MKIGTRCGRALACLPSNGDDVDAKLARPRSQRRFDAAQAAFDAVELAWSDAALWRRVILARFDFDRDPAATPPGEDVDLAGRQPQIARGDAVATFAQELAGEFFALLA